MKYCLLAICFLCISTSAYANDSAVYGVGGAIQPMEEHSSIRMVRERVDVKLYPEHAEVRCEFDFKNESKATTVKMGFPESAWGDVSAPKKSMFTYFRSYVDGKLVRTKLATSKPSDAYGDYRIWHLKNVPFAAGQTRAVTDKYTSQLGGMSDGTQFFSYILRTGKTWRGKIGRAVIVVDVSPIVRDYVIQSISPKEYSMRGNKITWVLRDFEPKEDIFIDFDVKRPILNGKKVDGFTSAYTIRQGVPFMPARFVEQVKLGTVIMWNGKSRLVTVAYGRQTLEMKVGSKKAMLNGTKVISLPMAPYIEYGRLYVPLAAVVKAFGGTAFFDTKHILQVNLARPQ